MYPHTDGAVTEEADFYRRIHTGYDLIYNPARTKFMRLVEDAGGKAFNGLKMLLYQGIIAYELWNGISGAQNQHLLSLHAYAVALHCAAQPGHIRVIALVKPIHPKEEIQIVLKRKLEKIVLYFYHRQERNVSGGKQV